MGVRSTSTKPSSPRHYASEGVSSTRDELPRGGAEGNVPERVLVMVSLRVEEGSWRQVEASGIQNRKVNLRQLCAQVGRRFYENLNGLLLQ